MQELTGKPEIDIANLYDQYIALRRELNDTLLNLDSDNVREINAERVKVFNLTADNIVTGTLTGITIRTGVTGARIVLNENGIQSYSSGTTLHGLVFNPAASNAEFRLFYHGSEYFNVKYYDVGLRMSAFGTPLFYFHNALNEVWVDGVWDFSAATVYGLDDGDYATYSYVDEEIEDAVIDLMLWVDANYVHV